MKKILVCGGRKYGVLEPKRVMEHPKRRAERKRLRDVMDGLLKQHGPFQLIHGGGTGADGLADDWAASVGLPTPIRFPALWNDLDVPGAIVKTNRAGKKYNVAAGPQRNQRMADQKPDLCVAFPGGTGTADMVGRARAAGIEVVEIQ